MDGPLAAVVVAAIASVVAVVALVLRQLDRAAVRNHEAAAASRVFDTDQRLLANLPVRLTTIENRLTELEWKKKG